MKKIGLIVFLILLLIGSLLCYYFYNAIYDDNIRFTKKYELLIHPNDSFEDLKKILFDNEILDNNSSFELVSKLMSFGSNGKIPSGRYIIEPNFSNKELISNLRAGKQNSVNLIFNNARTLEDLSGKLCKNLLVDSLTMLRYLVSSEAEKLTGIKTNKIISLFIPNTYKVYWNISPENLTTRMMKEHYKFWNDSRIAKSEKLGLSKDEVYTLASIVDKESLLSTEKPRIAGVYLNRLNNNIPLQADPTVVFALKKFDLRRILNKHLEFDSPYNTYKYSGLPPGPIGMASISGIDAVLDAETHDFIYFCAKPNGNGAHSFAKTLSGHNANARKYWNYLNKKGIR